MCDLLNSEMTSLLSVPNNYTFYKSVVICINSKSFNWRNQLCYNICRVTILLLMEKFHFCSSMTLLMSKIL